LVPIGALRWYRFLRYSGTDSCAMMVPFRRYYHVMRWTIVTLTDDTLKIKDEEGELITLKKDATSEPDIDITLLYNTWISETQDIYTFNNDGNGTYKAKEETSANDITYEYDEANKLLTLHRVNGKVVRWTILSLTNDTLKVKDNDGQELTLTVYTNTAWIELLYGKWGIAGQTIMEFTNREGNKLFTLHEVEEMEPYTVPFKYDAYNRIYFFENENWSGGFWWLAKFCPLSSLLIVLNQQLVKSCTMRQNFDGTKMGQNRRKIKPRPLCSEYPYQNTLVPSTKVQICPVKNEQMNLFLSFITHFSIILYHDRFFKVSDTLLHVLPLNNVSLIIVHCSRQMPIIRIGICTLLLSDLIQILRL